MRCILLSLLLAAVPASAQPAAPASAGDPAEAAIRADVTYLASDALKGREAGTADYDTAAAYVIQRMAEAGLAPGAGPLGAPGKWRQTVPLRIATTAAPPVLALVRDGAPVPLAYGVDYAAGAQLDAPRSAIVGRIVFAGLGVVDPATGRDDYRGLDVRGAIVVLLQARVPGYPPAVAAHLGNARVRAKAAAARGAKGVIFIINPIRADGFAAFARSSWQTRRIGWTDTAGRPRDDGAPVIATLSDAGAAKMFAGGALSYAAVQAAERASRPIPTGALAGTIRFTATSRHRRAASANIVGVLRGRDPRLAGEYVVLSAHLDHIGMSPADAVPAGGDRINNGAQDNAVGVALMLQVARLFRADRDRPRRSILFVALTGEEQGLLGSDYLAANAPVPAGSIVADVNLDMPILLSPLLDVVVHGGDRSSLGLVAEAAARDNGLTVAGDWEPEQGRFARSDQYSFASRGIPAISLKSGPAGGSSDRQRAFTRDHYHMPSDDVTQPIRWDAAPLFARLNHGIARRIADADARPRWNPGDFYGTLAAPVK